MVFVGMQSVPLAVLLALGLVRIIEHVCLIRNLKLDLSCQYFEHQSKNISEIQIRLIYNNL